MVDQENSPTDSDAPAPRPRRRRAAVREPGPPPPPDLAAQPEPEPEPERSPEPEPERSPEAQSDIITRGDYSGDLSGDLSADQVGEPVAAPKRARRSRKAVPAPVEAPPEPAPEPVAGYVAPAFQAPTFVAPEPATAVEPVAAADEEAEGDAATRRRRRGRRGRGKGARAGEEGLAEEGLGAEPAAAPAEPAAAPAEPPAEPDGPPAAEEEEGGNSRRRRRRRRRSSAGDGAEAAEPGEETAAPARAPRARRARDGDDEVQSVKGSTRLEAKRQRRRDGRDGGRRRPAVISESEFLARRESVERVMVVREGRDRTQIGVLEDGILVEHYVTKASASSYVGNVYLGRVQNVLPSMEAAFVDIGKGRNAVLYAGEVNYDASQFEGKPHRIEQALKAGDKVLVQVTKDPIGSKGARLTSQISLPGRYVVFVPEGERTGISRKLPDTERARLKSILKTVTPDNAGLIVRTAAEGASEEELGRDMARLHAQWEDIAKKAKTASAPSLLYGEPDLVIRVVRDVFNEDFTRMVVQAEDEWDTIEAYVAHVAPDLRDRLERWPGEQDVFAAHRIDEQLAKALERKVWLPSGGYLVFDRTEAMVVVDVNTGRFTGQGGNLEETVTRNNLEAAEEIVRQLRLRDLGGIIVIDFIDMVLERNRELVVRRLMECLGRDRTKHQVAEVTSLGLVQMTRKRVGQGLLEAFTQTCPECHGRGVKTLVDPFEPAVPSRAPALLG